jgi:hypothetical protein
MKPVRAWLGFALLLSAAAAQAGAPPVATVPSGQTLAWQQQMEQARRLAAAGHNYVLVVRPTREEAGGTGGVWVFYNNPSPFCYTYMIPGDWVAAREPNAYRSKDGRAFAGVLFLLPEDLEGVEGATLVERARTFITLEHQKALGHPLPSVELKRFESARSGTWKWAAEPLTQGDRQIVFPPKIIVDLSPDAVVQITVAGAPDNDGVARRIIESLRTTSDPECYWQLLENMLKAAPGNR